MVRAQSCRRIDCRAEIRRTGRYADRAAQGRKPAAEPAPSVAHGNKAGLGGTDEAEVKKIPPAWYARAMSKPRNEIAGGLTAGERDYIRRELDMFFSTLPRVADGFQLRTWRGGPLAGQPKIPPPVRSLLDRGLLRLDDAHKPPMVFFTEAGIAALRVMMSDRRLANPAKFAHVRRELGIDLNDETEAPDGDPGTPAPHHARR